MYVVHARTAMQYGQAPRVDRLLPVASVVSIPPPRVRACGADACLPMAYQSRADVLTCMLTVDARNGDCCSFLVLLRHMVWMHGLQCAPPAHAPPHPAWVFDGVQVCAAKRHAYVSGRLHTQTPGWSDSRVRRGSAFRGRLLVLHPRHRAALRRLLRRAQVPCCDDIVSLHAWLHNEADDGGWRLRPYIPLVWVRPPCSSLLQWVLPSRRTDTATRAHDTPDWEPDGDSAPETGTPVSVHPAALTGHKLALEHWASVTPEVQVLPLQVARRATTDRNRGV